MDMSKVRGGNALGLDVEGHLVSRSHLLAHLFIIPYRDEVTMRS